MGPFSCLLTSELRAFFFFYNIAIIWKSRFASWKLSREVTRFCHLEAAKARSQGGPLPEPSGCTAGPVRRESEAQERSPGLCLPALWACSHSARLSSGTWIPRGVDSTVAAKEGRGLIPSVPPWAYSPPLLLGSRTRGHKVPLLSPHLQAPVLTPRVMAAPPRPFVVS